MRNRLVLDFFGAEIESSAERESEPERERGVIWRTVGGPPCSPPAGEAESATRVEGPRGLPCPGQHLLTKEQLMG